MKVHPLEQFYKERSEQLKKQVREEQKALYEKKLQESKEARRRELHLIQDELTRITEQAESLKAQIDRALREKEA